MCARTQNLIAFQIFRRLPSKFYFCSSKAWIYMKKLCGCRNLPHLAPSKLPRLVVQHQFQYQHLLGFYRFSDFRASSNTNAAETRKLPDLIRQLNKFFRLCFFLFCQPASFPPPQGPEEKGPPYEQLEWKTIKLSYNRGKTWSEQKIPFNCSVWLRMNG